MGVETTNPPHQATKEGGHDRENNATMIKLFYLIYYVATGIIEPFLPIYFSSLGYGGQIIGVLGSISPIATFVVGPLWGVLSDRQDNPFPILYATITVSLFCQMLISSAGSFHTLLAAVCLKSVFLSPVKPLIDAVVLQQLPDRSEYGKVKLWSILGSGISTFVSGSLVGSDESVTTPEWRNPDTIQDFLTQIGEHLTGYRLLFVVHILLHVPVFFALRYFEGKVQSSRKKPDGNHTKSDQGNDRMGLVALLARVFQNMEYILFFAMVLMIGMAGGLADNFTYVRFREVGGTGMNMGLSRFLSSLAGAVMFYNAKTLASMLGTPNVMIASLLTIAIRFTLLATMESPIQGYVAEFLRGGSYGTFWSTATVFVSTIVPNQADATMIQLLNVFYNGLGRSVGSLVGGKLQTSLGTAEAFGAGASLYFGLALLYFLLDRVVTKRKGLRKDKVE